MDTGRTSAVKRIQLPRYLLEAKIVQMMEQANRFRQINHPGIIKFKGAVRDHGAISIVMEYQETSLAKLLKEVGNFDEDFAASCVTRILEALRFLHDPNIVHCNLKASSIFTEKNSGIKLSVPLLGLTIEGGSINSKRGTLNWMAPEVTELQGATAPSDIWSLGCTIVELLTGKPPFVEHDVATTVRRIVGHDMPPIPEGVSYQLEDFLIQCFRKDPIERPTAEILLKHDWLAYYEDVLSLADWLEPLSDLSDPIRSRSNWSSTRKLNDNAKSKTSLYRSPVAEFGQRFNSQCSLSTYYTARTSLSMDTPDPEQSKSRPPSEFPSHLPPTPSTPSIYLAIPSMQENLSHGPINHGTQPRADPLVAIALPSGLASLPEDTELEGSEHPPELLDCSAAIIQRAWRTWKSRQLEDPATPSTQSSIFSAPSLSSKSSILTVNDISHSVKLLDGDPIGCGGFCDLYLGQHSTHGKVALKRPRFAYCDASDIRRFSREAGLWCQISHPNILPFLETCTIQRNIYMVSPFIESGDLYLCIRKGMSLNRKRILSQIAEAIAYLHDMGIVHGDIKAQNVLLSDDGAPLLCDFGLSKAFSSMVTSTEVKGRGSTRWMAPELFLGANKTMSSDVFAFGMTVAEVLTGKVPFAHLTLNLGVMHAIVYDNSRPPTEPLEGPDGSSYQELWGAAERCWAKEAEDRPSMAEVVTAIGYTV